MKQDSVHLELSIVMLTSNLKDKKKNQIYINHNPTVDQGYQHSVSFLYKEFLNNYFTLHRSDLATREALVLLIDTKNK